MKVAGFALPLVLAAGAAVRVNAGGSSCDVTHCGNWNNADTGTRCPGTNKELIGIMTTEEACSDACGRFGAACCERHEHVRKGYQSHWYCLRSSDDGDVQTGGPDTIKAISCTDPPCPGSDNAEAPSVCNGASSRSTAERGAVEECEVYCGEQNAACCSSYQDGDNYRCSANHGSRVSVLSAYGAPTSKAWMCVEPTPAPPTPAPRPDGGAMSDMKGELMMGGALDASKAVEDLKKNKEELKEALGAAPEREELKKNNDELEKTVSALKEANAAMEAELAALRHLAAKEEGDEAKAPGAKAPVSRFKMVNAIRAIVRDHAAKGESGAVPAGEGEGGHHP